MKITLNKLMSWGPCEGYTKKKILEITKGRKNLSPLEVAKLRISIEDRILVLLRPEVLGKNNFIEIVEKIADRAIKKYCLKCGIALDVARADIVVAKVIEITNITEVARVVITWVDAWIVRAVETIWAVRDVYNVAKVTADAWVARAFETAWTEEKKWQFNLIKKYLR